MPALAGRSTIYRKNLVSVPRVEETVGHRDALEWTIPGEVSAALVLVKGSGYTLAVKLRVGKKHWWSRSWRTFVAHAPTPAEVLVKGLEFLESFGYTIDHGPEDYERLEP